MRKAYSYIRFSNESQQKGDSHRRQLSLSKQYADENNLEWVDTIGGIKLEDLGVSAFNGNNSEKGTLALFLDELSKGRIEHNSVLIVENLDRLSRDSMSGALTQFMTILNHGIEIVSLSDHQKYTKKILDSNPHAIFISIAAMMRANEESEVKSKRLKAAWSNKRAMASSQVLTKTIPSWLVYNEETKQIDAIDERVAVVQRIFKLCITTCGIAKIAKYLNEHHVPLIGKPTAKLWYQSYVKKILANRSVLGEFQPHIMVGGKRMPTGEVITNYFPQIIDEDTFLLANAAMVRRRVNSKGRKGKNFANLFTGFIHCGKCGNKMAVKNRGAKSKAKTYICVIKREGGNCDMSEWNLAETELEILQHLKEIDFVSLLGKDDSNETLSHEFEVLNEQLRTKEIELEKATDISLMGILTEESKAIFATRLNKLTEEVTRLNSRIQGVKIQLREMESTQEAFRSNELKQMLELVEANKDSYYFRSSLHTLLSKSIKRISLYKSTSFYPMLIAEDDRMVILFRKKFPKYDSLDIEDLTKHSSFISYIKQLNKRIQIEYMGGDIRDIGYGHSGMVYVDTREDI